MVGAGASKTTPGEPPPRFRHNHRFVSKHETALTRRYWEAVGGTLIEEFLVVQRGPGVGQRVVDAIILPKGPKRIAHRREVDLRGEEVIVVQTKASRLGMYVMGQAVFSAELVRRRFQPATLRSVIVCTADDAELRPFLDAYPNVEVVVMGPLRR